MKEKEILDVLVLGAGLSGLTAAYEIQKADPSTHIKILEAKDRVGGRTLTLNVDIGDGKTEKFDLGGQWVTGSQPDIMELLEELGLETYQQFITGTKVMRVGSDNKIRTYSSDIPSLGSLWGIIELQLFIWKLERFAKQVPIENPYLWDQAAKYDAMTMETCVRENLRTQGARDSIQAACRSVLGADLDRVSALFFLAYANSSGGIMKLLMATENGAQELRVKGGTQQISELLADRVGRDRIYLNEPVTHISEPEGRDFVTVNTESGKVFKAKRVIISLPPHCVARIQFSPPLSENRQLLMENMPVGHLSKFVITYDKPYWREQGYSGEVVSNGGGPLLGCSTGPISVVYDATTNNQVPALVGFFAGRPGVEWHHKSKEERKSAALSGLSECFGDWALKPTSYTEKIWSEEKYNGGCPVSFGVPGVAFTFSSLREPHGRIYWCGTETSTHWAGYLSGAVQSGRRAACEVMKLNGKDMTALEKLAFRQPYADISPPYSLPFSGALTSIVTIAAVVIAVVAVYYL